MITGPSIETRFILTLRDVRVCALVPVRHVTLSRRARALSARVNLFNPGVQFRVTWQPLGRLTVSGGVAAFPDNAQNAADLLRAADAALYDAKKAGRNQVREAGEATAVRATSARR